MLTESKPCLYAKYLGKDTTRRVTPANPSSSCTQKWHYQIRKPIPGERAYENYSEKLISCHFPVVNKMIVI